MHSDDESAQIGKSLILHNDDITDCVEIDDPKCIVTCSMDRSLVMFDMISGFTIRVIK